MLAARTTLPHFSVSSPMNFPNSAGEVGNTVLPRSANRAFITGLASAALISLLSLPMISAGVFFGAPTPHQLLASNHRSLTAPTVHGTHVPVEEPSTASIPDSRTAQKVGNRSTGIRCAQAQDVVHCHAVEQITLTESCAKNGDVPRSLLTRKSLMPSAGAKGDGTSMDARVTRLSIGAELYNDFVINVKK
jgi:hypothetical protein